MSRRATGLFGLTALAAAVILVLALSIDGETGPSAEPTLVAADVGFGIWLDGDPGELHAFCP